MSTDQDFKQMAYEIGQRIGSTEAHSLLTKHKIAPSTATKLLRGKYPSEVGALLGAAIVRADKASREAKATA